MHSDQRWLGGIAAALLLTVVEPWARAERPGWTTSVGVFGGWNVALGKWNLGADAQPRVLMPGDSAVTGLRVGVRRGHLGVEAGLRLLPLHYSDAAESGATALGYSASVVAGLPTPWAPYVAGGLGAYHVTSGPAGSDVDLELHGAVGVRGRLLSWLGLRVEGRLALTDGFGGALGQQDLELTFGLEVLRGGDGGGRPTSVDIDAQVVHVEPSRDRDGDGVPDAADRCPDAAGLAMAGGCPDSDADRVADRDDRCPTVVGPTAAKGCPDRDGDTVADDLDQCPEVQGFAGLAGCPDGDGDGVQDGIDRCPLDPGVASVDGCPDRDGDAIPDDADRCPDSYGLRQHKGCQPASIQKLAGPAAGVGFTKGTFDLTSGARRALDEVAAVLAKNPTLRLRIEAHTDEAGSSAASLSLSETRAEAVRAYLVTKGVDAERLQTVGQGDTQPPPPGARGARAAASRVVFFILPPA